MYISRTSPTSTISVERAQKAPQTSMPTSGAVSESVFIQSDQFESTCTYLLMWPPRL